jgi:hypothetical protein
MSTETQTPTGLRSSLANAAWAVEERVVWGAGDAFRAVADAVKWPFERIAWALERGLVWPLQERAGGPLQTAGIAAVILAAAGAGVAGLLWAAPDQGGKAAVAVAPPVPRLPIGDKLAKPEAPADPVLHGAAPVFTRKATDSVGEVAPAEAATKTATGAKDEAVASTAGATDNGKEASAAVAGKPAGPAALEVAHRFANAFVLYEIGKDSPHVHSVFSATATPRLKSALLRRPPRLPANVKVPRAKVLNLVPGPSHGGVYSISVSLLRVGLTSELRLDMEKSKKTGWRVTDVLG